MQNEELIKFRKEFQKIVDFANRREGLPSFFNSNIKTEDSLSFSEYEQKIEYIFVKLKKYCMDIGINLSTEFPMQRIYIICQNNSKQQQIYEICHSNGYVGKYFKIVKNLEKVDGPIINFISVIKYYFERNQIEELENIKMSIIKLKRQGLSSQEIENHIKSILYDENEDNKKIK